tara:strand:- start:1220 stop:1774 length:555 start_codon:yes stop_codon:yes gene_type:complete
MKYALLVISFLFLANCSKPKTVLICGDHVCVNKAEAEEYFKENLSIEVKVIDKKFKEEINLVELNLKENRNGKKKISILSKKDTNKELKILTKEEISKIKKDIKNKSKEKKIAKKIVKKKQKIVNKEKKLISEDNKILEYNTNKRRKDIVDVCTIIKECSIDEISKYLLKQGKKKDFPDITTRQ